jgi:DNA-binding MarR family transcriptional regulator
VVAEGKAMNGQSKASLTDENNPLFQEIARFRALIFDSLLKPHDMTMSQGWVLVHLIRENGMNQKDLAKRLEIASVTVSKLVDRLEARGYVTRKPDPVDRRSNQVYATDAAKDVVRVMTETIREVDTIANQGLDDQQQEALHEMLQIIRNNLKDAASRRSV